MSKSEADPRASGGEDDDGIRFQDGKRRRTKSPSVASSDKDEKREEAVLSDILNKLLPNLMSEVRLQLCTWPYHSILPTGISVAQSARLVWPNESRRAI